MDNNRIKEIAFKAHGIKPDNKSYYFLIAKTTDAIKQALLERDREIADWLEKESVDKKMERYFCYGLLA